MSPRIAVATGRRVLRQVRHDPRTIALLLAVPALLLVLMRFIFDGQDQVFQSIGAPLCGLFPFIVMFLISSITMLRERTSGTLERLMTMPMSKLDLLLGYGLAFGALAAAQAIVVCSVGFGLLGLTAPHGAVLVGALAILNAVLGMALGLLLSAFARTEFQAVQFMPAFVFPQILLCGLFVSREDMAPALEAISWLLPFTYAYDALARAVSPTPLGSGIVVDALVVAGTTIGALVLGALTLKRRTP
ncbi:MAG: ABC transporter permease [Solirubrobacterales bacterium]|nr:ABC transporter permease [Solirubrobacterales bacterium]